MNQYALLESNLVVTREALKPFVSVIIATRNEGKHIGKLLDSLVNQTYPKDGFEVIVVDGKSQDKTLEIVEEYKDRLDLKVFENPRIRSTYAFNKGLDEAKGTIFMIVSAHAFLPENFIDEDVDTFFRMREKEPKLAGVGGAIVNLHETTFGRIVGWMYSSFFSGVRSCKYRREPHFSDSVVFGVFDKNIVASNGKFDEDFTGAGNDDELPKRLRTKGYKFYTNPEMVVYYYTKSSPKQYLKQTFNQGVARGLIVRKGHYGIEWFNPASFWFVPACFLGYEILLLLLFAFSGFNFNLVIVPFLLYWLINVFVSLNLLIKVRSLFCITLPIMYFALHNVLGLSSLLGLIFGKKAFL